MRMMMIHNENQTYTPEISIRLKHMEMEIIKLAPSIKKYITAYKNKIMIFLIDYTKLAYLDDAYRINMNVFDKLIDEINIFNINIDQFNLLKAYYNHNCFRQTLNDKYYWHAFLYLQRLQLNNKLTDDTLSNVFYDNLLKWFEQKNRESRLNIQNNNLLFTNKRYGTIRRGTLSSEDISGIVKIPKEIMLIIMSFLPLKDVLSICMLNKHLYRIYHDMQLWKQIELSQMMTDINYLNHCHATPNFYLYNSQQRIRHFYAQLQPLHKSRIITNEPNHYAGDLLMVFFKIIVSVGILSGLSWCSYLLYDSLWSDTSTSLLSKISGSIVPLAICAAIGACGGGVAGLMVMLLIIGAECLIKGIQSSQINAEIIQKNIQNEQLRHHLENIVNADNDIESQLNNSTPTETDRILTVRH